MARSRPRSRALSLEEARIAWIDELASRAPLDQVPIGIGDDAAVWRPSSGRDVVATVDVQVAETHFRREWLTLEEAGARAVSASVSDLAAMAAVPGVLLVSLLVDDTLSEREFRSLARGIEAAARRYGAPVVGGNLSRGPLSITVTSLGEVERGRAIRRGTLSPGDEIWVTGSPGLARLGLFALSGRIARRGAQAAIRAWRQPVARLAEARWLAQHWALTSLLDLSDGLASDLPHLAVDGAEHPRAGIEVERAQLALLEPTRRLATRAGLDPASIALGGGEDYELCFACTPRRGADRAARAFEKRFELPLTRIGRAVETRGVRIVEPSGTSVPLRAEHFETFDHFATPPRGRDGSRGS